MPKQLPIVTDIPDDYARSMGRILVQWSYVEWKLRQITYRLLDIDPKRGRVAVREPRVDEFVGMFLQLMRLNGIDLGTEFLAKLPNDLRDAKIERDLVAHSVWLKADDGKLLVLKYSGNWKPDGHSSKITRRELPEGVEVTLDGLESIRAFMAGIADSLDAFYRDVDKAMLARKSDGQK